MKKRLTFCVKSTFPLLFFFLIFSYSAKAALNGTYTIDSSQAPSSTNYLDFASAISDMRLGTRSDGGTPNGAGVTGAVLFNVAAGTYTGQLDITGITGVSATNTITFNGGQGNASTRIITFSGSTSLATAFTVRINNQQFVRLMNLTIQSGSTGFGWPLHIFNISSNTIVRNCIIRFTTAFTVHNSTNFCGVVMNNSTASPTGAGTSITNVELDSNTILGGFGNYFLGNGSNTGIFIRGNKIDSTFSIGVQVQSIAAAQVNRNTINLLSLGNINGIGINFTNTSTTTSNAHQIISNRIIQAGSIGINISSSTGQATTRSLLVNNSVGGGFRNTVSAVGINFTGNSYNWDVFHNSVNLDLNTTGTQNASLFIGNCCTTGSTLLDIRNNIFAVTGNNSTAWTLFMPNGYNFAVASSAALNFNNYFKAGANTNDPIIWNGGTPLTVGNFINNNNHNANSISRNPGFISSTNLMPFNPCNNGTAIASVTTDINSVSRSTTAPDLGAFEVIPVTNDLGVEVLTAPVLPFSPGLQNIVVTLRNYGSNTITSANVSYIINGATPVTLPFTGSIAPCASTTFTFSAGAQFNFLPNTPYEIKAFSDLPNGLTDGNIFNDTSSVPLIFSGLTGTYTIDQASPAGPTNFVSFTSAAAALNSGGVIGPVLFNVLGTAPYNEQITLRQIAGASATNTITFDGGQGNAASRIITFAATSQAESHTIRLNNSSFVTLRNLTIRGTGTAFAWPIFLFGNNVNNIKIKNCIVDFVGGNGVNATSDNFTGIVASNSSTSLFNSATFSNIEIDSNSITGGNNGIWLYGQNSEDINIRWNTINNTNQNGIYAYYTRAFRMNHNTVNMRITGSINSSGIFANFPLSNGAYGKEIIGNQVMHAGQYGLNIYYMQGGTGNLRARVMNNVIGGTFRSTDASGIYLNFFNINVDVWFNSVLMDNISTTQTSAALRIQSNNTGLDVRNNNLAVTNVASTAFAFWSDNTNQYTSLNYNNYYKPNQLRLIQWNGNNLSSANYKGLAGFNVNSVNVYPAYLSNINLRSALRCNHGEWISSVTTDIEGNLRSNPPDIGAYENINAVANDLAVTELIQPSIPLQGGLQNIRVLIRNNGNTAITNASIHYSINGGAVQSTTWTGNLNPCDSAVAEFNATSGAGGTDQRFNFLPGFTYSITIYGSNPNSSTDGNLLNDTITNGPLCVSLNGAYTIDSGGVAGPTTFTTFTSAVQALNCGGISGPVTFNVLQGTYSGQLEFGDIPGISQTNSIVFDGGLGNDSTRIITFAATLNGARHTVLFNNTRFITMQNLTIRGTGATLAWPIHIFGNTNQLVLRNINVQIQGTGFNGTSNNFIGLVASGSQTSPTSTATFNNLLIENCRLSGGFSNVYFSGNGTNNNVIFRNNLLTNADNYGLYVSNIIAPKLNTNTIRMRTVSTTSWGIFLTSVISNATGFTEVNRNRIINAGQFGIQVNSSTATTTRAQLINNSIGGTFRNTAPSGIHFTSSNNWDIYFNSVLLRNNAVGSTTSAAAYFASGTGIDFRNNNLAVTDSLSGVNNLPFRSVSGTTFTPALNFNNYFKAGTPTNLIQVAGINYTPLNYQNFGGLNSISNNSGYTVGEELIPTLTNNNGIQISSVFNDIQDSFRNNPPDIGAYEIGSGFSDDLGIVQLISPDTSLSSGTRDVIALVRNFGSTTINSFNLRHTVNNLNLQDTLLTGINLGPNDTLRIIMSGSKRALIAGGISTTFKVFIHNPNGVPDNNQINDSIIIGPRIPRLNGVYTINSSGTGITNYTSFRAAVQALITAGISGRVTFQVAAGTYNEQVNIPAINGASAVRPIVFDGGTGNASTRIIDTAANTTTNFWTVRIDNSPFIQLRNLTINASGSSNGAAVFISGSSHNAAVKNCNINITTGASSTSTSFIGMLISNSTNITSPTSMSKVDFLEIDSNTFNSGYYNLYAYGTFNTPYSTQHQYRRNRMLNAFLYGSYFYYYEGLTFNNNEIELRTTGSLNGYGLYMINCFNSLSGTSHQILANKITNAGQGGIYITSGGGTTKSLCANNMIGGGFRSTNSYGMFISSVQSFDFFHNSVNVDFNTTSNQFGAFYLSSGSNIDVRNNIFVSAGVGLPVFVQNVPTGAFILNQNIYFRQGSASGNQLLFIQPTTYTQQNFIGGGGYNSVALNINPGFVSNTDLHLTNACAGRTVRLSNVTTDYDGNVRSSLTNYGADEATAFLNDVGVESIAPFSSGSQNVRVVIRNFGSNTLTSATVAYRVNGGLPRIQAWSGSLNPCDTTTVVFTGANQFTFLSGVTYTIEAYTTSPNLQPDPDITNDTAILGPTCVFLSGNYTINPSGSGANNFTSFTNALTALTCGGVSGPVVFNVAAGTYNEQLNIGLINGASAINTITFNGDSASNRIIEFNTTLNTAGFVVKFENTSFVTLRNLTIRSTGSSLGGAVQIANNSNNVYVSNCILDVAGGAPTSTATSFIGALVSGSTNIFSPSTGLINSADIYIDSCIIRSGYYGIYVYGNTSTYTNNIFTRGNRIDSSFFYGAFYQFTDRLVIDRNTVNMRQTGSNNSAGIYLSNCFAQSTNIITITNNQVYHAGQYGFYIWFAYNNASSNRSRLINNVVGGNFRSNQANALLMQYGYYWDVWFNTFVVSQSTNAESNSVASVSNCLQLDIRNNQFIQAASQSSGLPFQAATANQITTLNHNNYFNSAASTLLSIVGTSYNNLNYINGGGFNANSRNVNPAFVSNTSLNLTNACIDGVTIPTVTNDVNGNPRLSPPDIGAYEFTGGINNDIGITFLNSPFIPFSPGSYPINVRLNNFGANNITTAVLKYSINNSAPVTFNYTGNLAPCDTISLTISTTNFTFVSGVSYQIKVWSETPNAQPDGNRNNDTLTVQTCPMLPAGNYTINPSGTGINNFISFTQAAGVINCGGIAGPVVFTVSPGVYTEQVNITNVSGVSAINTITFDGVNPSLVTLQFTPTINTSAHTIRITNTPNVIVRNMTIISNGSNFGNPVHISGTSSNTNITKNIITFGSSAFGSTNLGFIGVLINNENNVQNPMGNGINANNIVIDSNIIIHGYYGICFSGITTSPYANGLVVRANQLDSNTFYGIFINYASGSSTLNNVINMRTGQLNSIGYNLQNAINNTGQRHIVEGNRIIQSGRYGAFISSAQNSTTARGRFVNNMIGGGFQNNASFGVFMQIATFWDVWHNTINLDRATTSNQNAALHISFISSNNDVRNNHLIYSATSGTGLPFYSDQTLTALNYNNYFNASSTSLLFAGSTVYNTSNYINGGGYNANSMNVNPGFINNLNLRAGGCFKGIFIPTVTTDIDGQVRNNPPDIGADEAATLDAGVIGVVSPLQPINAGSQTVAISVRNFGGNVINAITLTYNINGAGNVTQTFTGLTLQPCSTTTLNFTTPFNFPSGRSLISVFTSNPNGGVDNNRANDTLRVSLCGPLNGTYTINASGTGVTNFVSFTEAIDAMRCAGITGPVEFNVAAGTYNEQIQLPSISGASAINTITFNGGAGNASTRILSFNATSTTARHTIRIDSSQFYILNNLTIRTTGVNFGWAIHALSTSRFITVKNCIIDNAGTVAPSSTSTGFAGFVASASNTTVTSSGSFSDFVIDSNQFRNGYYAVSVWGNTTTNDTAILVRFNNMENAFYYGVYMNSIEGFQLNRNVMNLRGAGVSPNSQAISISNSAPYIAQALFEIDGNIITNPGTNGIFLSGVNGNATNPAKLYNNMIGGGFQSSFANGIYLVNSSNWNIYHNSVNLDFATSSTIYSSLYLAGSTANVRVRNNHLAYTATGGQGLAFYSNTTNLATGGLNFNNYFKTGIANNDNLIFVSTFYTPVNYIGGGGYNLNSFNREPGFRSALNLRTIDGCFNGDSLGVLTDIDGQPRGIFGDIGADEVTDANNDIGILTLLEPTLPLTAGLKDIRVIVKNFGTNIIYKGTVNYRVNGGAPVSLVFNDTIAPCDTAIVTFTGTNQFNFLSGVNYTIQVFTTLPNDSVDINNINDTFTTPALCIAMQGTYTINPTGTGATNYTSFQAAISALQCAGVSGPVNFNVAAGTYTEQLVIPAIAGASFTNRITFDGINASTAILTFGATTTNARQTVRFHNAQYVTLRNLTIRNSGATFAWPVHIFNGSRNITLSNNVIEITGIGATANNNNYVNVVVSGSLNSLFTTIRVDSITLDSNQINGGYASVFSYNQQSLANNFNRNTFNQPIYYGLYLYNANELKFRNNTINMSPTGDVNSVGAYLFVLGTSNNSIHEITGNRISNMGQYGIHLFVSSGSFITPSLIANNFIGGGFRNTTQHAGIFSESSSSWNIWFNSIHCDTISNAQFGAFHATGSNNLNVRNNIFAVSNANSNGIPFFAATTGNTSALDYNNYYKNGAQNALVFNGSLFGVNNFIGANGVNLNSFSRDPLFASRTDLHVGNGCNNGITIASITTDIDGQTRTSPPDVGADEVITGFNNNIGVTTILQPTSPLISGIQPISVILANLGNNAVSQANVSYQVNGGTPVTLQVTDTIQPCDTMLVVFNGTNAFNFQTGVAYTIRAYSSLPNGVPDANNIDDTVTVGPICSALSGNYTINPAGSGATNYVSFASAIQALNCGGIADDVTFSVSPGTYTEQINIGTITGANDTNTVSFIGTSLNSTILTFAPNNINAAHTLRLNNASFVRIRNITIQSTGANFGAPVHILGSGNQIHIKQCNIRISGTGATSSNTGYIGVWIGSSTDVNSAFGGTGAFVNNCEIDSNQIFSGYYGVVFNGRSSSTPYSNNNMFRNNNFDSTFYYGLYIQYASGLRVIGNRINMRVVGNTVSAGIYLFACFNNTGVFHQINANQIINAGQYGAYIFISSGSVSATNQFYNNMLGGGFRASNASGLFMQSSTNWNVYHNSVNLDFATTSNQSSAMAFLSSGNSRIANNILAYSAATGSGLPLFSSTVQTVINYNNYNNSASINLLNVNAVNYTNANYINGGGYNANGFNTTTGFTSSRNLFLNASTQKGDPTLGITTDIQGQLRATPPDIGADEYFGLLDVGISSIDSPQTTIFCGGNRNVIVRLRNYGNQVVNSANINVAIDGVFAGSVTWNGNLQPGAVSSQINAGSYSFPGGSYQLAVYSSLPNSGNDTIFSNDTTYRVITTNPTVTPTISLSASQTNICTGQPVTLIASYTGGGTTPVIQWRRNGITLPFNGDTLVSSTLANNDSIVVILSSSATCAIPSIVVSNAIKMNVGTTVAPDVNISASANAVCAGNVVTYTATQSNGGSSPQYRWFKNGVLVGGDSASYVNNTPVNNDSVRVVLISSLGCASPATDTSAIHVLTVNPVQVPSVVIQTASTSICANTPLLFVANSINGGTNPIYQWRINSTVVGNNNDSIILSNLNNSDSVSVQLLSNALCAVPQTVVSNKIGVTVRPVVNTSATINTLTPSVCVGTAVSFTSNVTNAGVNATYQWLLNGVSVGSLSTFSSSSLQQGDSIQLRVQTDTLCATPSVLLSNRIIMNVAPITSPSVTISSTADTVCAGTSITFTAVATNAGTTPSYQWLRNGTNVGTNSATFSYTPSTLDTIRVVVTSSSSCSSTPTAVSNNKRILVNPILTPSVSLSSSSDTICAGNLVTITANLQNGGNNPQLEWRRNGSLFGGNNTSQQFTNLTSQDSIWVTLTSNAVCANPAVVSSNRIRVNVRPVLNPSITVTANKSSICSGDSVIFTGTLIQGGNAATYRWKLNGFDVGNNTNTYITNMLHLDDSVWLEVQVNDACATQQNLISNVVKVNVNTTVNPSVNVTASSTSVCSGAQVTFSAQFTGGGLAPTFQWKRNGIDVGFNNDTFITSVLNNGDSVWVVLTSNAVCKTRPTATSEKVGVTISNPVTPSVSIFASEGSICSGSSVSYTTATQNGGLTPRYQWLRNGLLLSDTGTTLLVTNLAAGDIIRCVLTSSVGCVTRTRDTATAPLVEVKRNPNKPTITRNIDSLSTSAVANSYQWYRNGTILQGATQRTVRITNNGWYQVMVDSFGCTNISDSFNVTNIGISSIQQFGDVKVYPNPTNGMLNVELDFTSAGATQLTLIDAFGKQVMLISYASGNSVLDQLDLSGLADGMYMLIIQHDNQQIVKRVLKND